MVMLLPLVLAQPPVVRPGRLDKAQGQVKPQTKPLLLAANAPTLVLRAATGPDGTSVRLRWVFTNGWLPDATRFQLYREQNGVRTKLTPDGLTLQPDRLPRGIAPLWETARQSPAGLTDTGLFQPPPSQLQRPAASQQSELVRQARTRLMLGVLTQPALSEALGFGHTDTGLTAGETYSYYLMLVDPNRRETEAARVQVTVGADPQPAGPTGLSAQQAGVGRVALTWDAPSAAAQEAQLLTHYQVTRFDREHPNGMVLTTAPLLRSALPGPTFEDPTAPVGELRYTVQAIDAFGREGATLAEQTLTVADWATPAPGSNPKVALTDDGLPELTWTPNPDNTVRYRIWRIDGETEEQLTPEPVGGGRFVDSTAPRDRFLRYRITALYPRNGRDSEPLRTAVIGVPLRTPPAAPTDLAGQFTFTPPAASARPSSDALLGTITQSPLALFAREKIGIVAQKPRFLPEFGGTVALTWTAPDGPAQPYTYRLYRLATTGPAVPNACTTAAPAQQLRPLESRAIRDALQKVDAQRLLFAQPTLVAETVSKTEATDSILPSSVGLHYQYYVVARNRWGIEGVVSAPWELAIAPTLPPSVPTLLSVGPNPERRDQLRLALRRNPAGEEVVRYHLFRRALGPVVASELRRKEPAFIQSHFRLLEELTGYTELTAEQYTQTTDGEKEIFIDTSAAPDEEYAYRVVAENSRGLLSGRSPFLTAAAHKTTAAPPTFTTLSADPDGLTLTWENTEAQVVVERALVEEGTEPVFTPLGVPRGGTTLTDKTVLPGHTYRYRLRALDSAGNVSDPTEPRELRF